MTAALVVGLPIVLNVALMTVGMLWAKRQVKRVAAERVARYRGLFKLDPLPPSGDEVQILVEDDVGRVSELDAVHWPRLGWTDATTLLRVEDDVLGWRRHPFRQTPAGDLSTWRRTKLAAELARRFGEDAT